MRKALSDIGMDQELIEERLASIQSTYNDDDETVYILREIELEFHFMLSHIMSLYNEGKLDWTGVEFKIKHLDVKGLNMENLIYVIDGLLLFGNEIKRSVSGD